MKTELEAIPFDHYQRYATSARLIEAFGGEVSSVLEVGANRQRLLAKFLPEVRFVFSDLMPLPEMDEGFVQADATALPFADKEFDATVCLDVIEHMPIDVRAKAIAEMVRVSRRVVVVAFPNDKPWVHEAEARANQSWKHFYGSAYPWLEEHQEFGLVDGDLIEGAFRAAGVQVIRFGHADAQVWSGMMGAHFTKEKLPELADLVAATDKFYNTSVFSGDRGEGCYREFFVAARNEEDLERIRTAGLFQSVRNEPAMTFLAGLAQALQPIADRTLRAETGWAKTVEHARRAETGWAETAEHARQLESSLEQARQRVEQAEADSTEACREWGVTAARVRELEQQVQDVAASLEAASRHLEFTRKRKSRLQLMLVAETILLAACAVLAYWFRLD
jgi:SAM-dependent methyltransferase